MGNLRRDQSRSGRDIHVQGLNGSKRAPMARINVRTLDGKEEIGTSMFYLVNDRYSFFAHLQIPIICRSDIANYRHGADYLQIGHFICRYPFYLQIWSISANYLQVKKAVS